MDNHLKTENELQYATDNNDLSQEISTQDQHRDEISDDTRSFVEKLKEKKGIWAILGSLLLLLIKFKFVLFLILGKLKFLLIFFKIGKFGSTFISMFLMIWLYAVRHGWAFGVGFVLLIFIHEMGHYLMAKQLEIPVTAPLFIPFVGAFVSMKEEPQNAATEAALAIGGPLLGSFGALISFLLYYISGLDLFLALAYTGFMLNLFNLIPMHPIDGGRIVSAISPKFWYIGIPIMGIVAFKFFNPLLFLFILMGIGQAYKNWKNPEVEYYTVSVATRSTFAILYFGLIAALGIGMYFIHNLH